MVVVPTPALVRSQAPVDASPTLPEPTEVAEQTPPHFPPPHFPPPHFPPPYFPPPSAWEQALPDGFVSVPDPRELAEGDPDRVTCMGLTVRNIFDASNSGAAPRMGAHCWYTHYAIALSRPSRTLLMWEKGDAGTGITPIKAKQARPIS